MNLYDLMRCLVPAAACEDREEESEEAVALSSRTSSSITVRLLDYIAELDKDADTCPFSADLPSVRCEE